MSVKHALLALLQKQPTTAYELRKTFDSATNNTWPLNMGQVSTTLQRLQRDGLIVATDTDTAAPMWQLTQAGVTELREWWMKPVTLADRGRDELVVKVTLAALNPAVDITKLLDTQRHNAQKLLHDITRLHRNTPKSDTAARLVLSNHLFQIEAQLKWLDTASELIAAGRKAGAKAGAEAEAPRQKHNAQTAKTTAGRSQI